MLLDGEPIPCKPIPMKNVKDIIGIDFGHKVVWMFMHQGLGFWAMRRFARSLARTTITLGVLVIVPTISPCCSRSAVKLTLGYIFFVDITYLFRLCEPWPILRKISCCHPYINLRQWKVSNYLI